MRKNLLYRVLRTFIHVEKYIVRDMYTSELETASGAQKLMDELKSDKVMKIEINITQDGIQNDNQPLFYHKNLEKPTVKTQSDAKRSEVSPLENAVLTEVRHLRRQMKQVLFHLNSKTEQEKFHSQKKLPKDERARLMNLEEAVCGLVSSLDHQLLPYLERINIHKK